MGALQTECASRKCPVLAHLDSGTRDSVQKVHVSQVIATSCHTCLRQPIFKGQWTAGDDNRHKPTFYEGKSAYTSSGQKALSSQVPGSQSASPLSCPNSRWPVPFFLPCPLVSWISLFGGTDALYLCLSSFFSALFFSFFFIPLHYVQENNKSEINPSYNYHRKPGGNCWHKIGISPLEEVVMPTAQGHRVRERTIPVFPVAGTLCGGPNFQQMEYVLITVLA